MTQAQIKRLIKAIPAEKHHKALDVFVKSGIGKSTAYMLLAGNYPFLLKSRVSAACEKALKRI